MKRQLDLFKAFGQTPKIDAEAKRRMQERTERRLGNIRAAKERNLMAEAEAQSNVMPSNREFREKFIEQELLAGRDPFKGRRCDHGKLRCKACWKGVCPPDCKNARKDKTLCPEHGGSKLCPPTCQKNAGKQKQYCPEHGGSALCPPTCSKNAGKSKSLCPEHGGSALCPQNCKNAGKLKALCPEHGGSALCPPTCPGNAGKQKIFCPEHGGSALCPANCARNAGKVKSLCSIHGGTRLCCVCNFTQGSFRINGKRFCAGCRDTKIGKPKRDEIIMVEFIRAFFPEDEYEFSHNRVVPSSEAKREFKAYRPDVLFHRQFIGPTGIYRLILECDENKHRGLAYACDKERMNKIALTLGDHVHFIRFNPGTQKKKNDLRALAKAIKLAFKSVPPPNEFSYSVEYLFY